jgi:hypothetical protein
MECVGHPRLAIQKRSTGRARVVFLRGWRRNKNAEACALVHTETWSGDVDTGEAKEPAKYGMNRSVSLFSLYLSLFSNISYLRRVSSQERETPAKTGMIYKGMKNAHS